MRPFPRNLFSGFTAIIFLSALAADAASLVVDSNEPGAQVIVSNPHSFFANTNSSPLGERDTVTQVFSAAGGYGARGQSFVTPEISVGSLWNVSAITVRADANAAGTGTSQDLSGSPSSLKLWVFKWNPGNDGNDGTQWTSGNGEADGNAFDGTGVDTFLINGEEFDVTRSFSGEFLHFVTPGLQLDGNSAYGFLLSFESDLTSFRLDDVRDNALPTGQTYGNGGLLRADDTVNSFGSNGDDLVFYVQATTVAVPEPATIGIFAIGALALASVRLRKSE